MTAQNAVPILLLFVGLMAFALMARNGKAKRGSSVEAEPSYEARPIMTANEWEFFGRLAGALPECQVFPQVAMSALLKTARNGGKATAAWRNKISQKTVDYAVYGSQQLMCVVELDDRTHDDERDGKRDALLRSAGIRCVRWQSSRKPTADVIREAVLRVPATT